MLPRRAPQVLYKGHAKKAPAESIVRICNVCLVVLWLVSKGQEPWYVGGACTYGVQPPSGQPGLQ